MNDEVGYLPRLASRREFVDYLEGHPVPGAADIEHPDTGRKLVKTYMLETAGSDRQMPDLASRFAGRVRLQRLDDTLYRVEDADHNGEVVGLIEELDDRHPVFYTKMAVEHSDRWVRQRVETSPWLDRLWLSSPILFELWRQVQATTPQQRYARLGFEHEARYEPFDGLGADVEDDGADDADYETPGAFVERRRSVVTLTERLSVLDDKLQRLIESYDPLRSLVHLQMPAAGRGGHRLNYVVAIDRHLWQPFLLEVTSQHLLAVLPHGTCGNTVHRLVTNVQRELAPTAKAWLGSEPYDKAVADAAKIAA